MARRVRFGNKDFSTWVSNIKSDVAEEAAEAIIRQLQIKGPYWTGNFAGAWEARLGDVEIPADKQSLDRDRETSCLTIRQPVSQMETYSVQLRQRMRGANIEYTIDNRMDKET